MLSSYRSVLSRPGALRFSLAGLVGRLPLSMAGLGMLLLCGAFAWQRVRPRGAGVR